MKVESVEVLAFTLLAAIVGLLFILRIVVLETFNVLTVVLDAFMGLHHHVKRFRARIRGGSDHV